MDGVYWDKPGTTWMQYRKNFRHDHHHPADNPAGGPGPNYLNDRRVTFKHHQDTDSEGHFGDFWKDNLEEESAGRVWAGRTVFYELGSYPQVYYHDATEERRLPRQPPSLN